MHLKNLPCEVSTVLKGTKLGLIALPGESISSIVGLLLVYGAKGIAVLPIQLLTFGALHVAYYIPRDPRRVAKASHRAALRFPNVGGVSLLRLQPLAPKSAGFAVPESRVTSYESRITKPNSRVTHPHTSH